ncbi:MAG: NAD(P)H-binding protein [Candidatus Omnitrophica bacterium]|nr:NAD(P)H-binding protein [Candidatus Omnitrophota bacterium]
MMDQKATVPSVVISGATGYVGVHLVKSLIDQCLIPKCLVRSQSNPRDVELLRSLGAEIVPLADFSDPEQLASAMRHSDILVHLIGSIAPKKGVKLEELQTETAKRFFSAARKSGSKKIVLLTALGCGPDACSQYHRTKWLAEEALKHSGLTYVIFRPSLIVGKILGYHDSKIVRRYVELIQKKKSVPLILGGMNRIQPIFVGDLAQAMTKAIRAQAWDNSILELGGSETLSTRQFIERLMDIVNIRKNLIAIPGPLAWLAAVLCETFQDVPTLSRDQLKIAGSDSVATRNALTEDFKIEPYALSEALACYADHRFVV